MAMTLRLTDADNELLAKLANDQGISKHEAAVRAIRQSALKHSHQDDVEEAISYGIERWANVLERLGK